MIDVLLEQPLLLLFSIAALSYPLGRVRVGGVSLGVAAVLFVGLGFGALHPAMRLPDILWEIGLVLFVYTIGLMNGPTFFASLRGDGLKQIAFVAVLIVLVVALVMAGARMFGLSAPLAAGLFAGSLTNTPALAAIVEHLSRILPEGSAAALYDAPVVGYSLAYPVSVLGMIVSIAVAQKLFKTDYAAEARALNLPAEGEQPLGHVTLRVARDEAVGQTIGALGARLGPRVVFGRVEQVDEVRLATRDLVLMRGDRITVVGEPSDLDAAATLIGPPSSGDLVLDRSTLDYRRMFISSPAVAGHSLATLQLPEKHGALITRVRRGDVDLLPTPDLVLQPGDRVRVLAERERLPALSRLFGDSMRRLSEVDLLSFNVGLALGILVGSCPCRCPAAGSCGSGWQGGRCSSRWCWERGAARATSCGRCRTAPTWCSGRPGWCCFWRASARGRATAFSLSSVAARGPCCWAWPRS